jgi:chromosome segregation ATPase
MAEVDALKTKLAEAQTTSQAQAVELAQLRERLAATEQTAKAASEQHIAELARMNTAIEAERARHQQETKLLRSELADQKQIIQTAIADRDQARSELAILKAKVEVTEQTNQDQRKVAAEQEKRFAERIKKGETDQEQARKETSAAREESAKLRGQVEAMQVQVKELLAVIAASPSSAAFDTKKK